MPKQSLNSRANQRELSHRCALNTDGTQKLIRHIAELRKTTQVSIVLFSNTKALR